MKKKKGFTLIELMAVIIILAIIGLIATPIVQDIINDTREKSDEKSIKFYAKAVENAILAYQLSGPTPEKFEDLDIDYTGKVECDVKVLYADGSFYLEGCKVENEKSGNKKYSYGTRLLNLTDVCKPVNVKVPGEYNIGDEYTCEVKKDTNYTFFVLSKNEDEINLIMDSNINKDGKPIKETNPTDKGLVAWYANSATNKYGPVTAMEYLKNATSDWNNVSIITEEFSSENGKFGPFKILSAARLPKYSELIDAGCGIGSNGGVCPLSMANYLVSVKSIYPDRTIVNGVYGYWTLSASEPNAYKVNANGKLESLDVTNGGNSGVRPVINLKI